MSWVVLAGVITAALAWIGTRVTLALVRRVQVVALPNERSSHTRPTPSGGGVGLGVAAVASLAFWVLVRGEVALATLPAALVIACWCGWRDDVRPLPPALKMVLLTVAAVALVAMHSLSGVDLPLMGEMRFGILAAPLTLFWLAGFTNAFNFMDGIDGIAALTAVVSGAAYAVAGVLADETSLAVAGSVTAAAASGFLPWNFPRARIFMGDAGSLPLGLLLAYSAVLAHDAGVVPFPASVLLLGPFVFDTTFTLLRRLLRGERVWEAHKEHLYQRLSRIWGGHPRVSLLYAGFALATGVLALLYREASPLGRLLSLGVPLGAMLAFAAMVLAVDRKREVRVASSPEGTESTS